MKPSELYEREPESIVLPFSEDADYGPEYQMRYFIGCYYNHLGYAIDVWDIEGINRSIRVAVKVYKDFDFDGRRFWRLVSVWFDNNPVMILQNAGREGDDSVDRIITDKKHFTLMMAHILSLFRFKQDDEFIEDLQDPDEDYPTLTEFYGNSLNGKFERY